MKDGKTEFTQEQGDRCGGCCRELVQRGEGAGRWGFAAKEQGGSSDGNEDEEASGEVGILAEVRAWGGRQSLAGWWGEGWSGRGIRSSLGAGGVRKGSDEADSAGFF